MILKFTEVSKLQAANRQLNQAIRLFFQGGDMLAIHTLCGAAFQLYSDIGRPDGIASPYRTDEWIRPERVKEWNAAVNSTQNFLKHADRDLGKTLKYSEESTILFLVEVVHLGTLVNKATNKERTYFQIWFAAVYPELIQPAFLEKLQEQPNPLELQKDKHLWAQLLETVPRES